MGEATIISSLADNTERPGLRLFGKQLVTGGLRLLLSRLTYESRRRRGHIRGHVGAHLAHRL